MRNRLGALLCLAFGVVLIAAGVSDSASGTVGLTPPPTGDCGTSITVGVAVLNPGTCPTGTIALNETTDLSPDPAAVAPAGWQVTLTSVGSDVCTLPTDVPDTDSDPAKWTQTVANDGSVNFTDLYIFKDRESNTFCQYRIDETAVDGFTASFDPAPNYSFTYTPVLESSGSLPPRAAKPHAAPAASPQTVTLTNTAAKAAPPTSTTPTKTRSSSASTSPSSSATSSVPIACGNAVRGQYRAQRCPGPITSGSNDPATASSSPILANTGPNRPVKPSLYFGVALCLLGGVLLFAGRRRPGGEHA